MKWEGFKHPKHPQYYKGALFTNVVRQVGICENICANMIEEMRKEYTNYLQFCCLNG